MFGPSLANSREGPHGRTNRRWTVPILLIGSVARLERGHVLVANALELREQARSLGGPRRRVIELALDRSPSLQVVASAGAFSILSIHLEIGSTVRRPRRPLLFEFGELGKSLSHDAD